MRARRSKIPWSLLVAIGGALLFSPHLFAHRVIIFAAVEGERVTLESYIGNSPCRQCDIEVLDPGGSVLLSGKTEADGSFSFAPPAITDLRIVLKAGPGHRAETLVRKDKIRRIVREEVRRELEADGAGRRQSGPPVVELKDVISGLGYIAGLAGVAMILLSRRRNRSDRS